MQAMLLRFADTGEMQPVGALGVVQACDVRLITATNRDLRGLIATGAFRQDLFYRLNVIAISVPPLRDHAEDVPALLQHFLQRASSAHGMVTPKVDASAMAVLMAYSWPGNVRELRNVAERLVLEDFQRPVTADDLRLSATTQENEVAAESTESSRTAQLWEQFEAGKNFWTVVYQPFKHRELTRHDVSELIHGGLSRTAGSYRNLLPLFNLPDADYKRFHAFLRQQNCNLDVRRYRHLGGDAPADQGAVSTRSVRDSAAESRP
jgi:DNA-binding NtrC family response regulator